MQIKYIVYHFINILPAQFNIKISWQERIKYLLNFTLNFVDIHEFIFSSKIIFFETNALLF